MELQLQLHQLGLSGPKHGVFNCRLFTSHTIEGSNDCKTNFYTGPPNFATFAWLANICLDKLPRSRLLSAHDIILMVLMKLKLNLVHQDLAYRFDVSIATATELIMKSLPVIVAEVKFLIHWPSTEDCMQTMPAVFKPLYSSCRVIIDCTEVFIERPSNLTARATTYSNYKHHNNFKFLIAITPTGAVSFVSKKACI